MCDAEGWTKGHQRGKGRGGKGWERGWCTERGGVGGKGRGWKREWGRKKDSGRRRWGGERDTREDATIGLKGVQFRKQRLESDNPLRAAKGAALWESIRGREGFQRGSR